jgi:pimeloyl-ACP methyl ester carboxylesterase
MTVRSPYADRLATIPIVRRTVELSRGTTAYWEYGDADASTETLLVVHGYRGDHHGLEPVIAFLEGVRVISPDLPGFGETPPLDGVAHDIEAYADWLAEFAAAVAPGPPSSGTRSARSSSPPPSRGPTHRE